MHILLRAALACACALLALVGPLSAATTGSATIAQASRPSTVSGHVFDSRGHALSGAVVEVSGNGTKVTTTTDDDGAYSVSVPPGVYQVTVVKGGFQTAQQNDVAVTAGKLTVDVTVADASLQSLQIIGRTSAAAGASQTRFNISESAVSVLPPLEIGAKQFNNLTDIVATIPGVFAQRTFSTTPNTNFVVRGGALQTRVTLDGHPISSAIAGQWNTNYASSGIFNDVEVVKGAGLNGSIAGESSVGTVNLRTRDFTPQDSFGLTTGLDNYQGSFYDFYVDKNIGSKASVLIQKSFKGYRGPFYSVNANRIGSTSAVTNGLGSIPQLTGIDQWTGEFSNTYSLQAELAKLRWRFNDSSSVTFEFLGLQGQYQPQGGSYGTYNGQVTLQACKLASGAFSPTLAGCAVGSTYTPPYTFANIGQVVDGYTWFPNSFIQNNEPTFAAEFRTTFKNDTLQFRPYTHLINRYISGAFENQYPGNGGGWFPVTSAANCQAKYLAAGATGAPATGAAGPCFPVTMSPTSPAYIGADPSKVVFNTTSVAPTCSPTPPYTCFTTPTAVENDGQLGYGTPFSQPELDRLNGYTFSYLHPFGDHFLNFSIDYRKDFAQSSSSDNTLPGAGCTYTIGTVTGSAVFNSAGAPFQPGCSTAPYAAGTAYVGYNRLPVSPVGTPPTVAQYTDLALTGVFQVNDKLRIALGNYLELYRLNAQIEDPAVLQAYALLGRATAAPVALIAANASVSHYDPHLGIEYRASRELSLRASAGSSITQPYPALVSGFGSITLPNAANGLNYTVNIPNFNLQPEVTVAFGGGLDYRFSDGTVLALDAYHNTTHNVFVANNTPITPVTGVVANNFYQTQSVNGPLQRFMGLEASLSNNPKVGMGYYVSATLQRSFYDQLPSSLYLGNLCTVTAGVCTALPSGSGNFNISGQQIFGYPFFTSYMQGFYNGKNGELYELGVDLQGQDNSTFGPSYALFDMSVRYPLIPKRLFAQMAVQNLANFNLGTGLGRALGNQGNLEPVAYLNPVTGTVAIGGASTPLQSVPPAIVRMSLSYKL